MKIQGREKFNPLTDLKVRQKPYTSTMWFPPKTSVVPLMYTVHRYITGNAFCVSFGVWVDGHVYL